MGNGMPISAVVGRKEIMRRMEDIFFSTTFGGEALSLAAAIATINKLEAEELPSKLWQFGDHLASSLNAGFAEFGFKGVAQFVGDGWWPRIKLTDPPVPANLFTSLLRQSLNAHGLLLGSSLNLCRGHLEPAIKNETLLRFRSALTDLREALDTSEPAANLHGQPIQPTFSVR
jgi:acetylornithine/succinyldiaminopimelate/putrescine aminotransferase